mmetsp:Transcript_26910/g.45852  ORF Transcript_26910/g.45852 Transcript_26910/m.45852 type:complete len:83 (-) Transcript_26910:357-605(-)
MQLQEAHRREVITQLDMEHNNQLLAMHLVHQQNQQVEGAMLQLGEPLAQVQNKKKVVKESTNNNFFKTFSNTFDSSFAIMHK